MPVLDVAPLEYRDAATVLGQTVATQLRLCWLDLVWSLQECAGMAGSDEAGTTWGSSYDTAARSAGEAAASLLNACSRVGALLDQTGVNYACAEAASTTDCDESPAPVGRFGDDWCDDLDEPVTAVEPGVPPPAGWELLFHLVQRAWPDGHQDRLHRAAEAWRTAAGQLRETIDDVAGATRAVYRQATPESWPAYLVLNSIGDEVVTLAGGFDSIADACDGYAHQLDHAHHEIIGELRDFAVWTAGIETAGGLFAVVTFGVSEAVAQGTEALAMTRFANAIRAAVEALIAAARGLKLSVDAAAARVEAAAVRLRPILAKHLEQVRVAAATDRGELEIGKLVPSRLAAGKVAATSTTKALEQLEDAAGAGPAAATWGDPRTLADHFVRHGPDFGVTSEEDYARAAASFFRRAVREKLPCKIDRRSGTIRFYDPKTNTFGSYRLDGRTRTFYKPKPANYWQTQPGVLVHG